MDHRESVFGECINERNEFDIGRFAERARFKVEPPWYLVGTASVGDACGTSPACVSAAGFGLIPMQVYTQDPNAPARNVTIEDTMEPCPF